MGHAYFIHVREGQKIAQGDILPILGGDIKLVAAIPARLADQWKKLFGIHVFIYWAKSEDRDFQTAEKQNHL